MYEWILKDMYNFNDIAFYKILHSIHIYTEQAQLMRLTS